MLLEKSEWTERFLTRLLALRPDLPRGLLPDMAETFWYYMRHRVPEQAAQERAAGNLRVRDRESAWVEACSEAIRGLDPELADEDTSALAQRLWDADWVKTVDPYLMAYALWDQATMLARGQEGPIDPFAVFRGGGRRIQ